MKMFKKTVARIKQAQLIRQALGLSLKDLCLWRLAEGNWLIAVIVLFAIPFSLLCLYVGISEHVWQAFLAASSPALLIIVIGFFWNECIHTPLQTGTDWGREVYMKANRYETLKRYLNPDARFETSEELLREIELYLPRIADSVKGAQRRKDVQYIPIKRNEYYALYYSLKLCNYPVKDSSANWA